MMLFLLIVSLYFYCMFLLAEMFRTMLNNDDSRHYRFFYDFNGNVHSVLPLGWLF